MKASRLFCLLLASGAACAAPETANDAPPSAEFLEFLGEWQTKSGQPVDPFDLQVADTHPCATATLAHPCAPEERRQDAGSKPVEDKKHD